MDRPRHIDISADNSRASSSAGSRAGAPSPRVQHYDGDIPPTLSPLDALAAHSRKLAKELEETRLAGQRRMSRLPPQIVTQSLTEHQANRPAIFRSLSSNSQDLTTPLPQIETDAAGSSPDIKVPTFRPTSTYPRISAVLGTTPEAKSRNPTPTEEGHSRGFGGHPNDYFGPARAESPEPIDNETRSGERTVSDSFDHYPALAPPNAAFARNKAYNESSDDDYTSSNAGSFFSHIRKLSSSSNISAPLATSIIHNRSSSNNSATSLASHKQTPSHLNFSRPRSTASSLHKLDSPTRSQHNLMRKTSQTSEFSSRAQRSFDDARSVTSDGMLSRGSSSYTQSKYQFPRGRNVDRTPEISHSSPLSPNLEWQHSITISSPALSADGFGEALPSALDKLDREHDTTRPGRTGFSFELDGERAVVRDHVSGSSSSLAHQGAVRVNNSVNGRPYNPFSAQKVPELPPIPGSTYESTIDGQSRSSRSNSTVRPSTARSVSNYTNLTPDDHVTKAIDLHQHGDLKESTYHLRIAAKNNHATGMLLYALACRHGWGMRSNPKEGVAWLKKAVDLAMAEVAEDEKEDGNGPRSDFHQKKEHKAQFALSIYELGVSHLNGWGVEQDKALALRCFEIAGTWGDPDALSEAGFCYAEGIGCKKDMKKAAKFYRAAADKGISMIGNSWIYKEKYNDPKGTDKTKGGDRGRAQDSPKKDSSSAGRSKSKTRSMFGRKKSTIGTA